MLKKTTKLAGASETMLQEPRHPGKGGKPDRVIQLNCREVHTHASYKTIRACENFVRVFNGSKPIIRII